MRMKRTEMGTACPPVPSSCRGGRCIEDVQQVRFLCPESGTSVTCCGLAGIRELYVITC